MFIKKINHKMLRLNKKMIQDQNSNEELMKYYLGLYESNPQELAFKLTQFENVISATISNGYRLSSYKEENVKYFKKIVTEIANKNIPAGVLETNPKLFGIYERIPFDCGSVVKIIDKYFSKYENVQPTIVVDSTNTTPSRENGNGYSTNLVIPQVSLVGLKPKTEESNLEGLVTALSVDDDYGFLISVSEKHSTLNDLAKQYLEIYNSIFEFGHNDLIKMESLDKKLFQIDKYTKSILEDHPLFCDKKKYTATVKSKKTHKEITLNFYNLFIGISKYLNNKIHTSDRSAFNDKIEKIEDENFVPDHQDYMNQVLGNRKL